MNRPAVNLLAALLSATVLLSCVTNRRITEQSRQEAQHKSHDSTLHKLQKDIIITDSTEYKIKHYTFGTDSISKKRQIEDITFIEINTMKKNTSEEKEESKEVTTQTNEHKVTQESAKRTRISTEWLKPLTILTIILTIVLIIRKL